MDYSQLTDNDLLLLIKESNQAALTALISRYWDRLLAIAKNYLDVLEEAEECLQDVFFNFWKRRENLELKYSLATYLSVAVRYQSRYILQKQYRELQRAKSIPVLTEASSTPSPEELLLEKELFEKLEQTVKQLPEKCRIVFRMSREDGKSHKEIAAALGISENTVENHISRALKDVRNNLSSTIPAFIVWIYLNDIHHKM
jgi:RNA polymerase sigma-70 factor (ECF subfamily)